jgi:hypothetical protein
MKDADFVEIKRLGGMAVSSMVVIAPLIAGGAAQIPSVFLLPWPDRFNDVIKILETDDQLDIDMLKKRLRIQALDPLKIVYDTLIERYKGHPSIQRCVDAYQSGMSTAQNDQPGTNSEIDTIKVRWRLYLNAIEDIVLHCMQPPTEKTSESIKALVNLIRKEADKW